MRSARLDPVGVKHTVTLEIAGTKFRLVADADAQRLNELASLVNERVAKLGNGNAGKSASAAQLLALVALGLADDLSTCEQKLREVDRLTRSTITNVITRIDQRLADVPEPTMPGVGPAHGEHGEHGEHGAHGAIDGEPEPNPVD
jgi:cell division protein ZapA (FtsZ GTPase activity inhibitor)